MRLTKQKHASYEAIFKEGSLGANIESLGEAIDLYGNQLTEKTFAKSVSGQDQDSH